MPITANSRARVASSAAVPTRIAPWRSRSRRWISPVLSNCRAICGLLSSTWRLVCSTSSISAPYSGTSSRYMSDIALEKRWRIRSGLTKLGWLMKKIPGTVTERMGEKIAAFCRADKRRFLRTSFSQRLVHQFDPMPDRCSSGAGEVALAADVGGDDQFGAAAFQRGELVIAQLPGQFRLGQAIGAGRATT